MLDQGYITKIEYNRAIEKKLPEKIFDYDNSLAPHFSEYIRRSLEKINDTLDVNIYKDGLIIQTTLNSEIQDILEKNFLQ